MKWRRKAIVLVRHAASLDPFSGHLHVQGCSLSRILYAFNHAFTITFISVLARPSLYLAIRLVCVGGI